MRISQEKRDKISEQILAMLYRTFPNSLFTAEIAREIARDEEFTKQLLKGLWDKGLVTGIKKNSKGIVFSRRIKWRISSKAYDAYKSHQ
jgi:predicted transcriptional regulator with HTH domain